MLAGPVDRGFIDRAFDSIGTGIQGARRLRQVQTGYVRTYALGVLFGAAVMVIILFRDCDLLGMRRT